MIAAKNYVGLAITGIFLYGWVNGQESRVGIGTNTIHPNAILHLKSVNNNQGLMLTQLTPAQMNAGAMVNNLGMVDKGLMVYDTVRNGIHMWDGTRWKGSWVMRFPYRDSLINGPNNTNMLGLTYKGNNGASVGVLYLENQDSLNAFSPLFSLSNSKFGSAANFISNYPQATGNTISATQSGLGRAARFQVNNADNNGPGVIITTNGGLNSIGLYTENTGSGAGVVSVSNGTGPASSAIYGEHKGSGSAAGVFLITNAASNSPALYAQTNGGGSALQAVSTGTSNGILTSTTGSGNAVFAIQTGTGRALQGQITNPNNNESALRAYTNGIGRAGFFTVDNASNSAAGIFATHNGTGNTIHTENTANANALFLASGGMRLAVTSLNNGTNISVRTPVYDIIGGGPYTISFPLTNGEIFLFYNRTNAEVTVNSIAIPVNKGITGIVLGNQLRAL
jgi:hypothetical protein